MYLQFLLTKEGVMVLTLPAYNIREVKFSPRQRERERNSCELTSSFLVCSSSVPIRYHCRLQTTIDFTIWGHVAQNHL